jgi:hypothetical protein
VGLIAAIVVIVRRDTPPQDAKERESQAQPRS